MGVTGTGDWAAGRSGNGRSRVFLAGSASLETPAERALDRVLRSGHAASVLRLCLSRLQPSGPQPYHSRIARCLFDDTVQQGGGQVFPCKNGDLVLIAGPEPVASLGAALMRLFRTEAPSDQHLLGIWSLPADEASVRLEFAGFAGEAAPAEDLPPPLGAIAAIDTLLASARYGEFVRRQTAVRIQGSRMTDMFQELSVSLSAIEARIGLQVPSRADPYLFRYIAGQLNGRMLASLAEAGLSGTLALHINVPLALIASPGFAAVRDAARRAKILLGVEIALAEAIADIRLFQEMRTRLQEGGCTVALDGADHGALLQCDPAALQPDLLKLEWSPLIPALPAREQRRLRRALEVLGPDRVVVYRAETEAALVWGLGRGIACFQGRQVDLMLTADRLRGCPHAAACTLRQCIDRAAASDEGGQHGCLDLARLGGQLHWRPDRAAPEAVM